MVKIISKNSIYEFGVSTINFLEVIIYFVGVEVREIFIEQYTGYWFLCIKIIYQYVLLKEYKGLINLIICVFLYIYFNYMYV